MLFSQHRGVYYQELVDHKTADHLGVRVSSLLREHIEVGGAVLPHHHDVAEIIHITTGNVKLLLNGEWKKFRIGDTFIVPKGVVHSVINDDIVPTEQISLFLPASDGITENIQFKTYMVEM